MSSARRATRHLHARGIAVMAVALVLLTAGCSSSTSSSTDGTSTSAGEQGGGRRGVVEAGEPVEVAVEGGTLRLVLDSIELVTTCPGRGVPTQTPSFAYFLVLELTATLEGHEDVSSAALGAETFRITGPDGRPQTISSTAQSWECFDGSELLPAFVEAGQSVSGKVVLDAMSEHGTVSYAPRGSSDWRWSF